MTLSNELVIFFVARTLCDKRLVFCCLGQDRSLHYVGGCNVMCSLTVVCWWMVCIVVWFIGSHYCSVDSVSIIYLLLMVVECMSNKKP